VPLYIGTSGWHYPHWRGVFYPRSLPPSDWLAFLAHRFQCTEVNSTFYRLPQRATVQAWADATPDDFVLTLKFSRFLTHLKRLRAPEEAVQRFFERTEPVGDKLGPVLLQLPASLGLDLAHLEATLRAMPPGVRVAVEFRHPDWFCDETYALLRERGAALCLADRGSRPVTPLVRTASWGYVRFHEGTAAPRPCYGRVSLSSWAARIARLWPASAQVYAFFNNDARGCALCDARRLALAASRTGLDPTRVPEAAEVTLIR
jgi:uncharacterized protein YecE (DUF72 family)